MFSATLPRFQELIQSQNEQETARQLQELEERLDQQYLKKRQEDWVRQVNLEHEEAELEKKTRRKYYTP